MKLPLLKTVRAHFKLPRKPGRVKWSASKVKLFRDCKRKFYWKYILGITPRKTTEPLNTGGFMHDALERWYKSQRNSLKVIAKAQYKASLDRIVNNAEMYDEDEYEKICKGLNNMRAAMLAYADVYKDDRQRWKIKPNEVEQWFNIDMGEFDWVGKMDLLAREGRARVLVDHKSASDISGDYLARLKLDTQMRGYAFVCKEGAGVRPDQVVYNVIKKSRLRVKKGETFDEFLERVSDDYMSDPNKYFHREPIDLLDSHLELFEHEIRQTHREYELWLEELQDRWNEPREWTPNDNTCYDFHSVCEYHPLCIDGVTPGEAMWFVQNRK